MKKLIVLVFICCLSLVGCHQDETVLKIIVPNGIPSIAQSKMEFENHQYSIDRVSGPQPLSVAFSSESHDIIISPINLGANLYQKGSHYQLAGVLTWSNMQLISRQRIDDLTALAGEEIISFGEGAIPEMIVSYLFNQILDESSVNIRYQATSSQESLLLFMQGADYAIVSEPFTSQVYGLEEQVFVYDLADVWTEHTDFQLFPQAGIFIHQDLDESEVEAYLDDLEVAALMAVNQANEIAEYCEQLDYPFDPSIIESAIPNSHISFQRIDDSSVAVNQMLQLIFSYKPALIGGSLPDDDWMYSIS